ncbi:MAG: YraN family protein [Bacteroidetes bacterium]|nr:YraN family protein [Bacteroidota bacterium]
MNSVTKGKQGEDIAVRFLQKQGYTILVRNFYYQKAEIDIIAQKADVLCVVEVKWRKSDVHGAPYEFVTPKKRKLLARAAEFFIQKHNWQGETRFDIISITGVLPNIAIEHIESAFYFF